MSSSASTNARTSGSVSPLNMLRTKPSRTSSPPGPCRPSPRPTRAATSKIAPLSVCSCAGHPRHRGDRRGLVDGDEPADPVGAVLIDEAPPDRDAHRPAQRVEALEAEVVEQLVHVAREAGDPVAEVGLRGPAVPAQVEGHDPAIRGQVGELVAEHRLGLAPAVQHDEREPVPTAILVRQLDTIVRGKRRHRASPPRPQHQMTRTCRPPSTGSSVPVTYADSSHARNSAAFATSCAVPIAPVGLLAARSARTAATSWPSESSR